jgi:hypothetical protein
VNKHSLSQVNIAEASPEMIRLTHSRVDSKLFVPIDFHTIPRDEPHRIRVSIQNGSNYKICLKQKEKGGRTRYVPLEVIGENKMDAEAKLAALIIKAKNSNLFFKEDKAHSRIFPLPKKRVRLLRKFSNTLVSASSRFIKSGHDLSLEMRTALHL